MMARNTSYTMRRSTTCWKSWFPRSATCGTATTSSSSLLTHTQAVVPSTRTKATPTCCTLKLSGGGARGEWERKNNRILFWGSTPPRRSLYLAAAHPLRRQGGGVCSLHKPAMVAEKQNRIAAFSSARDDDDEDRKTIRGGGGGGDDDDLGLTRFTPSWSPSPTRTFVAAGSILQTLHLCGFQAFIVGGWVRDMCLERIPSSSSKDTAGSSSPEHDQDDDDDIDIDIDIDIATDATAEQVKDLFRRSHFTDNRTDTVIVVPTEQPGAVGATGSSSSSSSSSREQLGKKLQKNRTKTKTKGNHNTSSGSGSGSGSGVPLGYNKPHEVSTFRGDDKHCARSDALLRDFTVNALFYDVGSGEVIDYVGGLRDMRKKVLRAVGRAQDRFKEDPCRIMRAVRLCAVLEGFSIEEETYEVMMSEARLLEQVAPERLILEVVKCGQQSDSVWAKSLHILQDSGLHKYAFPEIDERSFERAAKVARKVELFLLEEQEGGGERFYKKNEDEEEGSITTGFSTLGAAAAAETVTGVRLASLLDPSSSGENEYKALALRSGVLRSHKKGIIAMSLLQQLEQAWSSSSDDGCVGITRDKRNGGSLISLMLDFYSYPSDLVDYCLLMYSQRDLDGIDDLGDTEREKKTFSGARAFLGRHRVRREKMSRSIEMRRSKTRPVPSKVLGREGVKPGPRMGELLQLAEEMAVVHEEFDENELLRLLKESHLWPVD